VFDLPLHNLNAIVFDLETTGFNPYNGDEIISIGAVLTVGQEVVEGETFYSLVNPGRPIPQHVVELTGISDGMAADAPDLKEVLPKFLAFVQRRILVAHGTGHDKQFLNAALWRTAKIHLSHRVLDTILVAKWLRPNLPAYDLDTLLAEYEIPVTTRHHALSDAVMTAHLWTKFMAEIADRNITSLGDLYARLSTHVT
jgi:DNA polymerase-3 subunit epsilon